MRLHGRVGLLRGRRGQVLRSPDLVDGNELNPAVGNDFAFDSTDDGGRGRAIRWESHAMARSTDTLSAGNHTVKVQIRTTNAANTLRVDDWALVVFRTKLS